MKVEITGHAHDGAGVGRIEGKVIFVPGALRGELIEAEICASKKGFLQGKVYRVIRPSTQRIVPACPVYEQCGGCALQQAQYKEQLAIKQDIVRDALERIGGFAGIEVLPVLGMQEPWHYRNKGIFQTSRVKGIVRLGFFEEGTRSLVPYAKCMLFSKNVTAVVEGLEKLLNKYEVTLSEDGKKGLLSVLIRESKANGDILLQFLTEGSFGEKIDQLVDALAASFPQISGISMQEKAADKVSLAKQKLSARQMILYGKDSIEERISGFKYKISANSFFQVNSSQAKKLFETAFEYVEPKRTETIIDLYCGTGSMSLFTAKNARRVIGIETMGQAVADARENAVLNRTENVEFMEGAAEQLLPQIIDRGSIPEAAIVDPPRQGCDRKLLNSITGAGLQRVVYVSCNPATLARDLKIMAAGGYSVVKVQPIDMFPQTSHVETVVLMSRVEK